MIAVNILIGLSAASLFFITNIDKNDFILLGIETILVFLTFLTATRIITGAINKSLKKNLLQKKTKGSANKIDVTLAEQQPGIQETAKNAEEIISNGLFGLLNNEKELPTVNEQNSVNFEPLSDSLPKIEENK